MHCFYTAVSVKTGPFLRQLKDCSRLLGKKSSLELIELSAVLTHSRSISWEFGGFKIPCFLLTFHKQFNRPVGLITLIDRNLIWGRGRTDLTNDNDCMSETLNRSSFTFILQLTVTFRVNASLDLRRLKLYGIIPRDTDFHMNSDIFNSN